jgi:hypothetical protein
MTHVYRGGKALWIVTQTLMFVRLPLFLPPTLRCSKVIFDLKKTSHYVRLYSRNIPSMLLYDDKSGTSTSDMGGDASDY